MKKSAFLLFAVLFGVAVAFAQVPQGINYQCIIRGADSLPVKNTPVELIFTIYQGMPLGGVVLYSSVVQKPTNGFGLFNHVLGMDASFAAIDWSSGDKWLRVSVDDPPGIIGEVQLVSVPYALYAAVADSAANDMDTDPLNELQELVLNGDTLMLTKNNSAVTLPLGTDSQKLFIISGNKLSIENGNTVDLPQDGDSSSSNEIQILGLAGDTLTLSNGGGSVLLPAEVDGDPANELQSLTFNGDTLKLSQNGSSVIFGSGFNITGNTISTLDTNSLNELQTWATLPDIPDYLLDGDDVEDADADPQNELQELVLNGDTLMLTKNNSSVTLPQDGDGSSSNEIQILGINGDTLTLSEGGGSVLIPAEVDGNPANELQNLSFTNKTLNLSQNGGSVTFGNGLNVVGNTVSAADPSTTNELQMLQVMGDSLAISNGNKIALSAMGDDWGNEVVNHDATLKGNGKTSPLGIAQQGATTGQVLTWNNGSWIPFSFSGGFWNGGGCNNSIYNNANLVAIGTTCPTGNYLFEVKNTSTHGIRVDAVGTNFNDTLRGGLMQVAKANANSSINRSIGLEVKASGGSMSNDGVVGLAFGNNDTGEATGGNFKADNGSLNYGLKILSGGSTFSNFPASFSQNIGAYIEVKDNSLNDNSNDNLRDIGLYVKAENAVLDYAAYFDGDVGIPQEIEFVDPSNGNQWALFIYKSTPSANPNFPTGYNNSLNGCTGGTGIANNDLIFRYESNVRAVIRQSDGTFCNTSDRRMKENINALSSILPSVKLLNPVSYNFISDEYKKPTFGFIAQEVEPLFPEIVHPITGENGETLLTLNYSAFSVIAIKAIQEQQQIIEQQKTQLESQQAQLAAQQTRLDQMEQQLATVQAWMQAQQAEVAKKE